MYNARRLGGRLSKGEKGNWPQRLAEASTAPTLNLQTRRLCYSTTESDFPSARRNVLRRRLFLSAYRPGSEAQPPIDWE
jgi:hypothetical protein